MDYKKKIIQVIDTFYVDCIEEFKEAEQRIANDSKFRKIFGKKDYAGNIELLRRCKKQARSLRFPTGDIPKGDQESKDLIRQTEQSIRQFSKVCDAYIQLQTTLEQKSKGANISYKDYMEFYHRTQEERVEMNQYLKDLDIMYTDYTEDEDYEGPYEFLTLADIEAED